MILAALLASAIAAGAPQTSSPPPPPARPQAPQIEVGLHTYRANDEPAGITSDSDAESFSTVITASESLCQIGGSNREPGPATGFAWRISGRIVGREGDAYAVQIDWRREWDLGARVTDGPKGSSLLTMRLGERILLDSVAPVAQACGIVAGRLEAALLMKTVYPKLPPGAGFSGGVAAGGAGGVRGGTAVGSGATVGRAGGYGASGGGFGAPPAAAQAGSPFEIGAWLVHRHPDGTEESQYQALHASSGGTGFVFAPVTFNGKDRKVTIELSGRLAPRTGAASTILLTVQLNRNVRVDGAPQQDARGTSTSSVVLTGPTDVVSFELPSPYEVRSDRTRDLLNGHQFSMRVKVTPVAR